jgi:hypothetical protein
MLTSKHAIIRHLESKCWRSFYRWMGLERNGGKVDSTLAITAALSVSCWSSKKELAACRGSSAHVVKEPQCHLHEEPAKQVMKCLATKDKI